MIFNKLSLGLVALVGFGLVATESAFTHKDPVLLKYRYTGSNASGTITPSNWNDISNETNPTGCVGTEIPCIVQFYDNEYDDMTDFLASHTTPLAIAESGKVAAERNEN